MLKTNNKIHLNDGRVLCYAEFGSPLGIPVVLIHGTPLCRLMWEEFSDVAEEKNVRIIAPDRPGYGYSDYNPDDNLDNFPSDVATLLDHLKIDKCTIGGISGGGPYTLMCALKIPERLTKVVLISSAGPLVQEAIGAMNANKTFYKIGKSFPWLIAFNNYLVTKLIEKNASKFLNLVGNKKMKGDDKLVFEDSEFIARLGKVYQEACRYQKRTIRKNSLTYDILHTINWKIPLAEIKKKVHIIYGGEDKSIGDQSKYLAEKLPNSVTHLYPNMGHFLAFRKKEEIFDLLV